MLTPSTGLRLLRLVLAIALVGMGVWLLVQGIQLELRNPRTNEEDDFAWGVLALGAFLAGIGGSMPFMRIRWVIVIGLASPLAGFGIVVWLVWGCIILSSVWNALIKLAFG
jgi:hypothetical protein